ncbi:PREDICTED: testis-expressed sequence 40 protein [Elephantulus edwardii]|uniref:testis-expressed sequence 40 protein n=1 Tax=Elephantulus edwardii TaxID=28737 RepID=UPI0003F097F7|nr:PREDICTED: testis-expressed sequence 40 protein [Elephantulus edwardii]
MPDGAATLAWQGILARSGLTPGPPPLPSLCDTQVTYDSEVSDQDQDIRELWTTATLSQPHVDVLEATKYSDTEYGNIGHRRSGTMVDSVIRGWEWRKMHVSLPGDKNFKHGMDERTLMQLELQRSCMSPLEDDNDDDDKDLKSEEESEKIPSSSSSFLQLKPHRAYWAEQQSRLPLPLIEVMENEALEILTKALQSYQTGIGWNHFLTKQLQRNIEALRKRRNKRLHVVQK